MELMEQIQAVTTFSTNSRPALRAAAGGGRPRAGRDTTGTGLESAGNHVQNEGQGE
jgi:hypothetical protein